MFYLGAIAYTPRLSEKANKSISAGTPAKIDRYRLEVGEGNRAYVIETATG